MTKIKIFSSYLTFGKLDVDFLAYSPGVGWSDKLGLGRGRRQGGGGMSCGHGRGHLPTGRLRLFFILCWSHL